MPLFSRRPLSVPMLAALLVASLVLLPRPPAAPGAEALSDPGGVTDWPAAPAPTPPAPSTRPSDEVVRLFRFHAAAQARALREAVDRATFDETLRHELRLLVREHLRRVDQDVARAPAAEPLDDLLDRAADLARDFNDRQVADWLDEHLSAYQPVQEQITLAEAYERATADEPDAIVGAARAAGLPPERAAALHRTVTAAHRRLTRANDADARRLREAEEKADASLPPGRRAAEEPPHQPASSPPDAPPDARQDAPANPAPGASGEFRADVPASFPRRDDGTAAPRGAAPPPAPPVNAPAALPPPAALSPEAEQLQLLDALTFADAHARLTAAAREVRAEAERLFPQPSQRKALDDEMLRWYQAYVPPQDAAPDDPAPDEPQPQLRRYGPTGKPRAPNDPGF